LTPALPFFILKCCPKKKKGKNMAIEFSSAKALRFTESVIREMTRICLKHQGVNLAQGFPDFPAPEEIKEAALRAIQADLNQYAITWGTVNLRQAIADMMEPNISASPLFLG
jgi:aspartate/methionine/tyrosine aminotransferase